MSGIEIGALVRLRSGGPVMVVFDIKPAKKNLMGVETSPEDIYCEWFRPNGKDAWNNFSPRSLEIVSPT